MQGTQIQYVYQKHLLKNCAENKLETKIFHQLLVSIITKKHENDPDLMKFIPPHSFDEKTLFLFFFILGNAYFGTPGITCQLQIFPALFRNIKILRLKVFFESFSWFYSPSEVLVQLSVFETVQGVRQNCMDFCFLQFLASQGSRNFILDIFQLPFPCRFVKQAQLGVPHSKIQVELD